MDNYSANDRTYGPDGIDGSAVGRNLGLASLVLGVGGLLLSWAIIGAGIGAIAIVIGLVAIVKSMGAKRRVAAAGREPRTSGAFGLALVGIITGIASIAVASAIYLTALSAVEKCDHLEKTTIEYQKCLREQSGLSTQ